MGALEEAGLDYRVRLLEQQRPPNICASSRSTRCHASASVEPAIQNLASIDLFFADQEWAKQRRAGAVDFVRLKLKRVSDWLGDKEWLEGRYTIGDLLMVTVLRILRHTDLVAEFPNLAAYVKRGEARPAFKQALSDQLAVFTANQMEGETA